MYITNLTDFPDKSGAIEPVKGPARTMAQFLVNDLRDRPKARRSWLENSHGLVVKTVPALR